MHSNIGSICFKGNRTTASGLRCEEQIANKKLIAA